MRNPKEPILSDVPNDDSYTFLEWEPLAKASIVTKSWGAALTKPKDGEERSDAAKAADAMALARLRQLTGRYTEAIADCESTLEAFKVLEEHFEGETECFRDSLQTQFLQLNWERNENIRDYFYRGKRIFDQLVKIGFFPDKEHKSFKCEPVRTIIKGIGKRGVAYMALGDMLYAKFGDKPPPWTDAMRYFEERAEQLQQLEKVAGAGVPAAGTVAAAGAVNSGRVAPGGAGRSGAGGNQGQGLGSKQSRPGRCWHCDQPGHLASRCPGLHQLKQQGAGWNGGGGGAVGQGPGGWPQQQQQQQQQQQHQGGWRQQQQQQQQQQGGWQQLQQPRYNSSSSGPQRQQPPAAGGGGHKRLEFRMSAAVTPSSPEWVMDSGAFASLTYDRSDLWGVRYLDKPVRVQFGQGEPSTVNQHGRMNLVTMVDGEERLLRFESVLFVPAARVKALSVVEMDSMGVQTTFRNGAVRCSAPDGTVLMQGRECDRQGVYVVDAYTERPTAEEEAAAAVAMAVAAPVAAAAERMWI